MNYSRLPLTTYIYLQIVFCSCQLKQKTFIHSFVVGDFVHPSIITFNLFSNLAQSAQTNRRMRWSHEEEACCCVQYKDKALSGLTSSGYYQSSDASTRGHSGTRWFVRFVWIYMNCWKLPHLKTPAASWTEYHSSFLRIIICSMSPSLREVINKAESDSSECLRQSA